MIMQVVSNFDAPEENGFAAENDTSSATAIITALY
jgi:hypothetical protein